MARAPMHIAVDGTAIDYRGESVNVTLLAHSFDALPGGLHERDRIMRETQKRFESELGAWHGPNGQSGAYLHDRVSYTYRPSIEMSLRLRGPKATADAHADLFWRFDRRMQRDGILYVPFKLIDWAIAPSVLVPSLRPGMPHKGSRPELLEHLERIKRARLRFVLPLLEEPIPHAVRNPAQVLEFYTALSPLEQAMVATVHRSTGPDLDAAAPLWVADVPAGIGLNDQDLEGLALGLQDKGWLSNVGRNGVRRGHPPRSLIGAGTPTFEAGRGPKLRRLPARELLGL